jgi:hypothetical protein
VKHIGLNLEDLNIEVRRQMLSEIESDIDTGKLYISSRLNNKGREEYPELLKQAAEEHDDVWLAQQIATQGLLKGAEPGMAWGNPTVSRMDWTAPVTLAEGEFNRYYMRGLCLYAIANGVGELEVYRAKEVTAARGSSRVVIGHKVDPQALLDDCRAQPGPQTRSHTGLPAGPNSGLSARVPR